MHASGMHYARMHSLEYIAEKWRLVTETFAKYVAWNVFGYNIGECIFPSK
jgi:hypothetical protein